MPKNVLPLHLKYALDKPGSYSVRWTRLRKFCKSDGSEGEEVMAQSKWMEFKLNYSLSSVKNNKPRANELLWQIVDQAEFDPVHDDGAHSQAVICLTWMAEQKDLRRLGELMLKFRPSDKNGDTLYSLPEGQVFARG